MLPSSVRWFVFVVRLRMKSQHLDRRLPSARCDGEEEHGDGKTHGYSDWLVVVGADAIAS